MTADERENETVRERRARFRGGGASPDEARRLVEQFGSLPQTFDVGSVMPAIPNVEAIKIPPKPAHATTAAVRELIRLQQELAEQTVTERAADRRLSTWTFWLVAFGVLISIGSLIVAIVALT